MCIFEEKNKNMIRGFVLFFCLLYACSLHSQTPVPYVLRYKHESIYAAYSLVGLAAIYTLNARLDGHAPQDINSLNSDDIWKIDRNTIYNYSESKAHISDYVVGAACLLSVGGAGLISLRSSSDSRDFVNHAGTLAILWAEANAVSMITANVVKSSVQRTRPYVYNPDVDMEKRMEEDARKSFFSGHTTFAATNCFFAAHVVSSYYPRSWLSYGAWTAAAIIPASVAYLRVESGRHFPTDVLAGYIVGATCGALIPYVHSRVIQSNMSIGMSPQMVRVSFRL